MWPTCVPTASASPPSSRPARWTPRWSRATGISDNWPGTWATSIDGPRSRASTGSRPDPERIEPPPTDDRLADWLRDGVGSLADTLADLDPDVPTWHPFPVEKRAGVWPRRQAQETLVHRWDAEHAVGALSAIDATLASDGIDEYFEVMLPRSVTRESLPLPTATMHVHCTDVDGEWLVKAADGVLVVTREHAKGDAALRGRAQDLLLSFWGRDVPVGAVGAVDVVGDPEAAEAWLSLGGA